MKKSGVTVGQKRPGGGEKKTPLAKWSLVTMAHQGAAAYREEFDLLYRRESPHANAMWQADHTPLDVLLLDEAGKPAKPWLTAIGDDYSRAIVGYRLSFIMHKREIQDSLQMTIEMVLGNQLLQGHRNQWGKCPLF